jgi:hypothetical protein
MMPQTAVWWVLFQSSAHPTAQQAKQSIASLLHSVLPNANEQCSRLASRMLGQMRRAKVQQQQPDCLEPKALSTDTHQTF